MLRGKLRSETEEGRNISERCDIPEDTILFNGVYYPVLLFRRLNPVYFSLKYRRVSGETLGRYVDIRA